MKELETLHGSAREEANKVPGLQAQLAALHVSSQAELEKAIDDLKAELESKHKAELDTVHERHAEELTGLRTAHETHVSEIKDLHEEKLKGLSDISVFQEELRSMKEQFEADKRDAVEKAINETRAGMVEELRSFQIQHTRMIADLHGRHQRELATLKEDLENEKTRAVDSVTAQLTAEHNTERMNLLTAQRETQQKANGDMKTLSDAHSAKIELLENQVIEAQAALSEAEEKAKKATIYQQELETRSKELDQARFELETVKRRAQELEIERTKYLRFCRSLTNRVRLAGGEETPLSELD